MKSLANLSKTYAIRYVKMPENVISNKELENRIKILLSAVQRCQTKLCVHELAKILKVDEADLKRLISKHLLLFRNYYLIPATISTRAAADFINLKIRENPLPYVCLVLALVRFSGITTDLININSYQFRHYSKKQLMKLRISNKIKQEHKILAKLTNTHIDLQAEMLLFLLINYGADYEISKKGGKSLIAVLLYELSVNTYLDNFIVDSTNIQNNNGDLDYDKAEKLISGIDKKDLLHGKQDTEIERYEISLAAQSCSEHT